MKVILVIVLLAAFCTAFFWERSSIGRLREENQSLGAQKIETARLAAENRDLPKLRAAAPAPAERGAGGELLRLRNEVRRLREQQPEVTRLRVDNERMATEINSGKFSPRRLADL